MPRCGTFGHYAVAELSNLFPGGDTSGVFNGEYRIPIVGPVSMSLFIDVGYRRDRANRQLQLNSSGLPASTQLFPGAISNTLGIRVRHEFQVSSFGRHRVRGALADHQRAVPPLLGL